MAHKTGTRAGRGASGHHHHHRHRGVLLAAGAAVGLVAVGLGAEARAQQWTVISLHPEGSVDSDARAVHGVTQGGVVDGNVTAAFWRNSPGSVVRLNPRQEGTSQVRAVYGGLQAGIVAPESQLGFAALWSGSAQSWVNLHPSHEPNAWSSGVSAMDGGIQGGSWVPRDTELPVHFGRACIWSGTPESWVDLNPPGVEQSNIVGMGGGQQVGVVWDTYTAALWTGTAESYVNLNPPEAFISVATCTDGTHQYGIAALLEPVPGLFPVRWSGTAESLVNMGVPEGWAGEIGGVHGGWAAGRLYTPESVAHAAVWTDGPGSYVDLHDALPPGVYDDSYANAIWRHTESGTAYIVGAATDSATGRARAMMWVTGPGVNLITGAGAPADCAAGAGDEMVFTARVTNAGADAAGAVTLTVTLPPASVATFVGSTPAPSSVSPTEVTFDLGSLAAAGGAADVTVTLAAVGAGQTAEVVFSASAAGEVHAENNTTTASSRITPAVAATAAATAIFSTDPALANSAAPGTEGRFNGFGRPLASPSGNWWLLRASTDLGDQARFVILRTPTGGQPELLLHEGVTQTSGGTLVRASGLAVNDAGVVAVAGSDAAPSSFVARTTGAGLTDVARTGQTIPALPDETYVAGPWAPVCIAADGSTAFGTGTFWGGLYGAYLSADGAQVIAQVGETPEGAEWPIGSMGNEFGTAGRLAMDATGTQYIFEGLLATGIPDEDHVLVANGTAVVMQGVTVLPGLESPVAYVGGFTMGPDGTWLVRGLNRDLASWALTGHGTSVTRVFKVGEPIHPGATEAWRTHPYDGGFFAVAADAAGNFIVGGHTDRGNDFEDAVLVYNGEVVVARENDPVDLDGNGVFDDGVYIRSIDQDSVAFIPGAVLFTVSLRDEDGALCRTNNIERGQAIVRVGLPGGACPVDWNDDGVVNSSDISAFLSGWLMSLQGGTLEADFNGDSAVNSSDISAFLTAWLQAVTNGC